MALPVTIYNRIAEQCAEYSNFVSIQRRVETAENLTDFENYKEL